MGGGDLERVFQKLYAVLLERKQGAGKVEAPLCIDGDPDIPFEWVAKTLDQARKAKFKEINFKIPMSAFRPKPPR